MELISYLKYNKENIIDKVIQISDEDYDEYVDEYVTLEWDVGSLNEGHFEDVLFGDNEEIVTILKSIEDKAMESALTDAIPVIPLYEQHEIR